jgi:hypothetical protein
MRCLVIFISLAVAASSIAQGAISSALKVKKPSIYGTRTDCVVAFTLTNNQIFAILFVADNI